MKQLVNEAPRVSVIIPFFKYADWLDEALKSAFSQTYKNFEIILVDDGSTEDVTAIVASYDERLLYIRQENQGAAVARNRGLAEARGEYIAFLDSDDLWEPEKLSTQVNYLEKTGLVWCSTDYSSFNSETGTLIKTYDLSFHSGNVYPMCLLSNHVATPTIMVKKEVLDADLGLRFCNKMRFGQDVYLWLLLSQRFPLAHIPQALTLVRIRGGNTALRARAHLQVRAELWKNLSKHQSQIFYEAKNLNIVRLNYRLTCLLYSIQLSYEKLIKPRSVVSEYLARMLYAFPFAVFKLLHRFHVSHLMLSKGKSTD
jgi:teichuronic acid biosynthesis glycosyltransferase TuaG